MITFYILGVLIIIHAIFTIRKEFNQPCNHCSLKKHNYVKKYYRLYGKANHSPSRTEKPITIKRRQ